MLLFLLRRVLIVLLSAFCLTLIVFLLTNLSPNLEKLAKSEAGTRITDREVAVWLEQHGHARPLLVRYASWLGLAPAWAPPGRHLPGQCAAAAEDDADAPRYCGILQGNWGTSTVFRGDVATILGVRLALTGNLMLWVMLVMVPSALLVGVLAGMREGSVTDRTLSSFSIVTSATPEYVSGVILIAVFASSMTGLKWFSGTAGSVADKGPSFDTMVLPVTTIALYGMGYVARMTRASMAEVMTQQYIRTARLKGVSFRNVVLKHALRNALIAPFTVIMLQFPWLLNGVVIVETLFNYKGFGWTLVEAAGANDIDLMLGCSVVAVVVVLVTQLLSDLGYVLLNPRIRVH